MKKKVIKTLTLALVLCIVFGNVVKAAQTYEVESPKLPIITNMYLEDSDILVVLEEDNFKYELTPITEDAPLPDTELTEDGKWSITVPGDCEIYYVDPINFTKPGVYEYKFSQVLRDNEYMTYDEKEYIVIYDVTNTEDLNLQVNVLITDSDKQTKYDSLTLNNKYFPPAEEIDPDEKDSAPDEDSIDTSDIQLGLYLALFGVFSLIVVKEYKKIVKN